MARLAGLAGTLAVAPERVLRPLEAPGRPARPVLVAPSRVPQRSLATGAGRAALFHALAHIEFNAINLALDAIARFADLPCEYYRDWLRVAADEARHFGLLERHLATLGARYGDFAAHDGLWEAAVKTAHDPLLRMALVPRILEARGLDVTPGIQRRLCGAGDVAGARLLDVILRDEIVHVSIGNRWYRTLCAERGLEPVATFLALCAAHGMPALRPPHNAAARLAAGFEPEELSRMAAAGGVSRARE